MNLCLRCHGARWICEAHPDRPWGIEGGCRCGAPGEPCPVCNGVDNDDVPEVPQDFVTTAKRDL
jgi:hypothetical protein